MRNLIAQSVVLRGTTSALTAAEAYLHDAKGLDFARLMPPPESLASLSDRYTYFGLVMTLSADMTVAEFLGYMAVSGTTAAGWARSIKAMFHDFPGWLSVHALSQSASLSRAADLQGSTEGDVALGALQIGELLDLAVAANVEWAINGRRAADNAAVYQCPSLPEWCLKHWGTSREGGGARRIVSGASDVRFSYHTWRTLPDGIYRALTKRIAGLEVEVQYVHGDADRCGTRRYAHGELVSESVLKTNDGSHGFRAIHREIFGIDPTA